MPARAAEFERSRRLALAATIAFYGVNGLRLALTNDRAYELIIDVASGRLDDVPPIAAVLADNTVLRG